MAMAMLRSAPRLVAVLGPTNTGKTHFAIERMLDHPTRHDRLPAAPLGPGELRPVVKLRGARAVALITGEEKILPPNPSYFVCTVESMPLDRPVEFLAVDEIQLCADPERGHVFTARLLHARGMTETMFLGADTIKPLMRRLVPNAEYISRPRFSTLAYTGHKKVTRLPRRSAVVAFSLADVFSLAELVRRQRGGTAVVLGALSPRARNAQVGMFQAGEVDYLVATDAIGMGLNMDLDHVAFARLAKFDGRGPRRLSPAEIGADRRARRPPHERRHVRHHGRRGRARTGHRHGGRGAPVRAADPAFVAQHAAALQLGRQAVAQPRRAPADARARAGARRRRPPGAAAAVAQRRGRRLWRATPVRCGCSGRSARFRISAR